MLKKKTATFNSTRWLTHLALLFFSLFGCGLAFLYAPTSSVDEVLSIGSGYVGLVLLALSLLIGPFNLLRKRKNPVNIDFRRDVGIWAGITGLLHVVISLQLYNNGDILSYFFTRGSQGDTFLGFDLFNLSNYIGLAATVILAALLITSNQLSLRYMKGKRWKLVQRFNYPLAILVVLHTFGYQALNVREGIFALSVIVLSLLVVAAQLGGVAVSLERKRKQQVGLAATPAPAVALNAVAPQLNRSLVARRRFLIVGGVALLTAGDFAAGIVLGKVLHSGPAAGANASSVDAVASNPQLTAPSGSAATSASTTNTSASALATPTQATLAGTGATATPTAGAAPATTARAATATTAAAQSTTAASTRSIILASAANLAPGSAMKFTTPDTGESAILVHQKDGSVKAYSSICTHRPYNLVFNSSSETLVCNLHRVAFNLANGAPESRPASIPLKSFKVQLDGQGNIVYAQA